MWFHAVIRVAFANALPIVVGGHATPTRWLTTVHVCVLPLTINMQSIRHNGHNNLNSSAHWSFFVRLMEIMANIWNIGKYALQLQLQLDTQPPARVTWVTALNWNISMDTYGFCAVDCLTRFISYRICMRNNNVKELERAMAIPSRITNFRWANIGILLKIII